MKIIPSTHNLHTSGIVLFLTTFTDDEAVRVWRLVENGRIVGATIPEKDAVIESYRQRRFTMNFGHMPKWQEWREHAMVWHADIRGGVLLREMEDPLPNVGYRRETLLGDPFVVPQSALMGPFCRCGRPLLSCPQTSRNCSSIERTRRVRQALEKRDDAC